MKTKTNIIVIASIFSLAHLQAQTAVATPAASATAAAPAAQAAPTSPGGSTTAATSTTPATAAPASPAASSVPPQTVDIVLTDMLSFSVTKIEAKPGQTLTVRLKNNGTLPKDVMGHNWILLKGGADMNAYAAAAAAAKSEDFQPKALNDQVLASIPMIGAKQSGEVTFTCPTTPGTYNYLCSCYGHSMAGMKGVLIVK